MGFIATEGEAQAGAVSRGWMVRSITIFSVLVCVLCVYVSVAYVLWKQFHVMEQMNSIQRHFHRSEIAAQREILQHLQAQMQHQMKIQNATATLHSDIRDLSSKSFLTLSYVVRLQEDLRKRFEKLHQDETTAQREMRLELQLQMHNVTTALHTNLQMQMQMQHQMEMHDVTSDIRNLSTQSLLLNSNIVQMQRDLKVQDQKQQLRIHNVTAALYGILQLQMQHQMRVHNVTSDSS